MQLIWVNDQIKYDEWLEALDTGNLFRNASSMHQMTAKFGRVEEQQKLPEGAYAELMVRIGNMIMRERELMRAGQQILRDTAPKPGMSLAAWASRNFDVAQRSLKAPLRQYSLDHKLMVFEVLRSLSPREVTSPMTFRLMVMHSWCMEHYLSTRPELRVKIQMLTAEAS